jgi:hypothetical protein
MLAKDSVDTRQVRDEVLADEEAHQRAANLLAQVPTGSVGIPQCRNSGGGTDKRRVRLVEDARAADALPVGDEALEEVVLPRPQGHARRQLQEWVGTVRLEALTAQLLRGEGSELLPAGRGTPTLRAASL